jgi:hypothetical protein
MVQDAPPASEEPQLPAAPIATGAAAPMLRPTAVVRLFLTVNVTAELAVPTTTEPKFLDVGEIVTGLTPVPCRLIVWAFASTLSVTVMLPVRLPVVVGVKVTVMTQAAPPASEDPQVFVCVKSPVAGATVNDTALVLVFRTLTFELALVPPTATDPKNREVEESVMTWACAAGLILRNENRNMQARKEEPDQRRKLIFINTSRTIP